MAKYGNVDRIAAVEIVLGAAMPPISTNTAVAMNAFAASGSSVRSMPNAGNRRRLVRSSAISFIRPPYNKQFSPRLPRPRGRPAKGTPSPVRTLKP